MGIQREDHGQSQILCEPCAYNLLSFNTLEALPQTSVLSVFPAFNYYTANCHSFSIFPINASTLGSSILPFVRMMSKSELLNNAIIP